MLTGGAGYVGSHIAVDLIEKGIDVIIADNLSNSSADVIENIEKITGIRPKFYKIDITDLDALRDLFKKENIDSVIHLAGKKAIGESIIIPLDYYNNNLNATITLLKVMDEFNVNNVVFSSSATVYGNPEKVPLTEEMSLNATNPYGWTKLVCEQIFRDAAKANKDLSVVLLRYFNPVGAHKSGLIGERPNGIPNNLMPYICYVAARKLDELSIYGDDYPTRDGTGIRDYTHILDLARGHLKALKYAENHKGIEVFNLGTGKGYSVLEMVKTFQEVNQIPINYKIAPRRSGDIAECYSDSGKAKEILGWEAKYSIEDMCRDSWNFVKSNYGKSLSDYSCL